MVDMGGYPRNPDELTRLKRRIEEVAKDARLQTSRRTYVTIGNIVEGGTLGPAVGQALTETVDQIQLEQAWAAPEPPAPEAPTLQGEAGLLTIHWNGDFTPGTDPVEARVDAVEIHASKTAGATPGKPSLVGAFSTIGGSFTTPLEVGVWYVVLVARSTVGKRSLPSAEAAVEVVAPVGSDIDVEALKEEFRAVDEAMDATIQANKQTQDELAGTVSTLRDTTLPALDRDLALAKERLVSAETDIRDVIPMAITTAKNAAIDVAKTDAAADAKTKADKALEDAKADAATRIASVVNTIMGQTYYGTAVPSASVPGGAIKPGSTYRRKNASGNVIGEYEYTVTSGTGAWVQRKMTSESFTAVDVGVLTAGSAVILEAVAQKIAAATAAFQKADIGNLTVTGDSALNTVAAQRIAANVAQFLSVTTDQLVAGSASLGEAVARKFAAETGAFMKLFANQVYVGDAGNQFTGTDFMDPGWAKVANISYSPTGGRLGGSSALIGATSTQVGAYFAVTSDQLAKQASGQPSTPYNVGFWVRGSTAIPIGGVSVYLRSYSLAGANLGQLAVSNKTAIPANTWSYVEGIVDSRPDAARLTLGIYAQAVFTGSATFSDLNLKPAITPALVVDGLMNGKRIVGSSIETNMAADAGVKLNDNGLVAHGIAKVTYPDGVVRQTKMRAVVDSRVTKWSAGPDDKWPGLWLESTPISGEAPLAFPPGITIGSASGNSAVVQSASNGPLSEYSEIRVAPASIGVQVVPNIGGRPDAGAAGLGLSREQFGLDARDHNGVTVAGVSNQQSDGKLRVYGKYGVDISSPAEVSINGVPYKAERDPLPMFVVGLTSGDQSALAENDTAIRWNVLEMGDNTGWSATQPTRLYARRAGSYFLTGNVTFSNMGGGMRGVWFRLNGVTRIRGQSNPPPSAQQMAEIDAHNYVYLNVGDYIEVMATVAGASGAVSIKSNEGTRGGLEWKRP